MPMASNAPSIFQAPDMSAAAATAGASPRRGPEIKSFFTGNLPEWRPAYSASPQRLQSRSAEPGLPDCHHQPVEGDGGPERAGAPADERASEAEDGGAGEEVG